MTDHVCNSLPIVAVYLGFHALACVFEADLEHLELEGQDLGAAGDCHVPLIITAVGCRIRGRRVLHGEEGTDRINEAKNADGLNTIPSVC